MKEGGELERGSGRGEVVNRIERGEKEWELEKGLKKLRGEGGKEEWIEAERELIERGEGRG